LLNIGSNTKLVILLLGLLLPCIRFNSNTFIVKQQSYDQKYFAAYVEYLRGQTPSAPLKPATNWRIGLPAIAFTLPFKPATSLNIVNYVAFILTVIAIITAVNNLNKKVQHGIIAAIIFTISFPSFYYSCIGYADTLSIMFISIGILAVISGKTWLFACAFIYGFLTKETVLLLLPFYGVYNFYINKPKAFIYTTMFFLIALVLRKLTITIAPVSDGFTNQIFWEINSKNINTNLNRFNTWFSGVSTFLPVFMVYVVTYKNIPAKIKNATNALIVCALLLWIYSFITTISD